MHRCACKPLPVHITTHTTQGNFCKHILFVYLRALKLSPSDPLLWQKALLATEVRLLRFFKGKKQRALESVRSLYTRHTTHPWCALYAQ